MTTSDLKKLAFVPEGAAKGASLASSAYATAKTYVPAPLQPQLARVEDTLSSVSAPYVTLAQDKGTELLKAVDNSVRGRQSARAARAAGPRPARMSVAVRRTLAPSPLLRPPP